MKSKYAVAATMLSLGAYAQGADRIDGTSRMRPDEPTMRTPLIQRDPVLQNDPVVQNDEVVAPGLSELKQKVSAADQKFITDAALIGLAEVEMGRLAKTNGKSDSVKKFGQKLIDDHQKANRQLAIVAGRLGVALPEGLDETHHQHLRMLGTMREGEFDTNFARHMVEGHEKAITMFKKEAKSGQSRDLRDFADKTLPTLQEHLQLARDLRNGNAFSSL